MVRVAVAIVGLALAQAPAGAPGSDMREAGSTGQDAAVKWSEEHYADVLNQLLPLSKDEEIAADTEWRMVARVRPVHDPEAWLRVTKTWSGAFSVSFARAEDRSLLLQLEELRRKEPEADLAEVARRVKIDRTRPDPERCPQLRALLGELSRLRVPAIPSSDLAMDATLYEVVIRTRTNHQRFSLSDVAEHPFVRWIAEAERLARGCHD